MRYQAKMTEASLHQNPFLISNCFISFRNQVSTFRSLALWPNLWRKTARSLAMIKLLLIIHEHVEYTHIWVKNPSKSDPIRSISIYLYLSLSITIYHYPSLSITIYGSIQRIIYTILLNYNIYIYISILHGIYFFYTYWHALFLSYDHCRQQHETLMPTLLLPSFQIVTLLATCRSERRCVGLAWLKKEICPNMCPKPRKPN